MMAEGEQHVSNGDGTKKRSFWQRFMDAFSLEADYEPLTEREIELLDKIAGFIVRRRMVGPAMIFLESVKPLNYVGSQAMAFFEPTVRALFSAVEYSELRRIFERRQSIETLLQRIEKLDAKQAARWKAESETEADENEAKPEEEPEAEAEPKPEDETKPETEIDP